GEGRRVVHREIGEDLAVDLDTGEPQALGEPVVRHAVHPRRGVDARDPQLAEVALAVTAVPGGVLPRGQHLLLGLAVEPGPLAPVTAGALQDGTALLLGVDRPLDACHVVTPFSVHTAWRASAAQHLLDPAAIGRPNLLVHRQAPSFAAGLD